MDNTTNYQNELPSGWQWVKLGDVCEKITKGSSPSWQDIKYTDKGVLFITSENVGIGQLLFKRKKYVEEKFNEIEKKSILQEGDVLTNIVGASIGRTAIFNLKEVANINQAVCILRCDKSRLNNSYLMNLLNSDFLLNILHENTDDNARANLSLGFFDKLEIPLPPLPEQQRLAKLLTEKLALAQQAKQKIEAQLEAAQQLTAAYLREVFESDEAKDWELFKLGNLTQTNSGTTPSRTNEKYYTGSIPWIKTGELKDCIIYDAEEYVSELALKETSLKLLPENTLLVAMYGQGQTRGRTGLLAIPATINQACFAIQPNSSVFDSFYLQYWFRYKYQSLRDETEGRGGSQSNLNGSILNEQKIPLPPIEKQKELATYLSEKIAIVEQLKTTLLAQLESVNQIPSALLKQAFNGEL